MTLQQTYIAAIAMLAAITLFASVKAADVSGRLAENVRIERQCTNSGGEFYCSCIGMHR